MSAAPAENATTAAPTVVIRPRAMSHDTHKLQEWIVLVHSLLDGIEQTNKHRVIK
jgi:hypothetical protein